MSKYRSLENTIKTRRKLTEKVNMEKDMNDQVFAGTYRSKHFEVSPDAQRIYFNMSKDIDPMKVESSVKAHDQLFGLSKKVKLVGYATAADKQEADTIVNRLKAIVSLFELPVDHAHIDQIHKEITSKVKDVPDIVDDKTTTVYDVKNRFASPPKQEQPEVGVGNDVDIDQKVKTPQRTSAIAKQRYLNLSVGESMSFKTLSPDLIQTVNKVLRENQFTQRDRLIAVLRNKEKQGELTDKEQKTLDNMVKAEKGDVAEARGVADQAVDPHNCATHVYHEQYGFGNPIHGQHADPDNDGNIEWYDIKFEDGTVVEGVLTSECEVLVSEMHGGTGHKKGKKGKKRKMATEQHTVDEAKMSRADRAEMIRQRMAARAPAEKPAVKSASKPAKPIKSADTSDMSAEKNGLDLLNMNNAKAERAHYKKVIAQTRNPDHRQQLTDKIAKQTSIDGIRKVLGM